MVQDTGGLAKVTASFANEMKRRGHEVTLLYSDERQGDFFYPIEDGVACYDLRHANIDGVVQTNISYPRTYKIKRELLRAFSKRCARTVNNDFFETYLLEPAKRILAYCQPDIIVSFQPAASKVLLCDLKTNIPVITMSHGDPEDYFHIYPVKEIPAVEKSTINQVLLPSFEQHIKNHLPKAKTITIGNAIPQFAEPAALDRDKTIYKILFVGRLTKNHKRPHLLIEAFSKISKDFPNWQVELWGPQDRKAYYKTLETLIKSKGLETQVQLCGSSKNIPEVLRQGDIIVMPSAYEGFGMALAEGMSAGLPAIGYKNCPAVNELIEHGKTGFLCEDGIEDMADKLRQLMENRELRSQMGKAAHEAMKAYAPEKIWDQWEDLMKHIVEENKR